MKIFVVNLKKHTERLDRILEQFERFNITNFEIVEAVDGKELTQSQLDICYDPEAAVQLLRKLTSGEIGCALSHVEVCRRIIKENRRCLVIEDDVIILDSFKNFVDLEIEDPCDVVFFGVCTSNIESDNCGKTYPYKNVRYSTNANGLTTRCYLENSYAGFGGIDFYDIDKQSSNVDFLIGTSAYAPSVSTCHAIINFNYPAKVPADHVWAVLDQSFKVPKNNIIEPDPSIKSIIQSERTLIDFGQYSNLFRERESHKWFNK